MARTNSLAKAKSAGPQNAGGGAPATASELDRLIHERMRLGIVSALAVNESLTFNDLKKLVGKVLRLDVEFIEAEAETSEYGFDSITFTALANELNADFGWPMIGRITAAARPSPCASKAHQKARMRMSGSPSKEGSRSITAWKKSRRPHSAGLG